MPPLLIAATTPDAPGFTRRYELKAANSISICCAAWRKTGRAANRFNAPGETLLGAFVNHQLVGYAASASDLSVRSRGPGAFATIISERYRRRGIGQQLLVSVITHSSAWFDFLNTHAPRRPGPFMKGLVFARCTMNRG